MQTGNSNSTGISDHASLAGSAGTNGHAKRTRVLLSCAPCRNSKLKCDRATPCGQCLRKGKPDGCQYAPRLEKQKPAKSMAARLKRLEGMVRNMIDDVDGSVNMAPTDGKPAQEPNSAAFVVQGQTATSYVGGTHFMAILEDIEDLKNYFEDSNGEDDENHDPFENMGPTELLMASRSSPKNKKELLALLPEKAVIDRLSNRYFNSNSPSQHIVHVPTFLKEYNQFLKDPNRTSLHWIALLYMILALGTFFSSFSAPHEVTNDPRSSVMDKFKQFRGAAGWALLWGKYSQPNQHTLQAFTLYVEGDFMTNRENRMNCYLLSSVLIRLMLKMGLHRDPSKMANITPYDSEMRRRLWNLAIQLDLLVAFNLGLPGMIHGIESDTQLPTHLMDSEFDTETKELPPARPDSDYTPVTYPINKAKVIRAFGLVARQAHSLTAPSYAEVLSVDARLEEVWKDVPPVMKMRPMEESVMDPPVLVIQRFGLAAIYQKSRCVLHRRYLAEVVPKEEHDYSRRMCLDAALTLLNYQDMMHNNTKPGGILNQTGWFVSALVAVNDFLLAGMVVALVLQNDKYWEVGSDFNWIARYTPTYTRDDLLQVLQRSHEIWEEMASDVPEFKKAQDVVRTILRRIQVHLGIETADTGASCAMPNGSGEMASVADLSIGSTGPSTTSSNEPAAGEFADFDTTEPNLMATDGRSDPPWMMQDGYDWTFFDAMTREGDAMQPEVQITQNTWLNDKTMEDFPDFLPSNSWKFGPI